MRRRYRCSAARRRGRSRRAQQTERMRRIGVLMGLAENDPDTKPGSPEKYPPAP
jgi:hypothetical protein